jgi:hypothetical protein
MVKYAWWAQDSENSWMVQNMKPTKWWGSYKTYVYTKRKYNNIEGDMGLVCSKNGVGGKFILIGKSKKD